MSETKNLRTVIDEADAVFRDCHALLRADLHETDTPKLLALQPQLARAIYSLEQQILDLKKRRRELTTKKNEFSRDELNKQFRHLAGLIHALGRAIDYGKVLGDAFAWLFYAREEKLLRRHYAHQKLQHLPAGIGGMGEIEFITNTPKLGNHLALHHGITTFLRIGDVSLVNLENGKVEGMAELKSQRTGPNHLTVSVTYIGKKLLLPPPTGAPISAADDRRQMGEKLHSIVERQTAKIKEALLPTPTDPARTLNFTPAQLVFNPGPLVELYDRATTETASAAQISPGVMLVGVKLPVATLAERVLNEKPFDVHTIMAKIAPEFRTLVLAGSTDNVIELGWLVFPSRGRYELVFGTTPVIWWPVRTDVVDALVSGTFLVMPIFNPAHMVAALRKKGFAVRKQDGRRRFELEMPSDGGSVVSFRNVGFFFGLVARHLITENSVVELLASLAEEICGKKLSQPARIDLEMSFRPASDELER